MRRVVVVGGSQAGHQVACSLRHLGYGGDLTVLSAGGRTSGRGHGSLDHSALLLVELFSGCRSS